MTGRSQSNLSPLASPADHVCRDGEYQLHIAATSVPTVVQFVGGWIFDQVRAGWDVVVLVPDHDDDRPLRILGAEVLEFDLGLAMHAAEPELFSLAVAADLYDSDARVRDMFDRRLRRISKVSALWGAGGTTHISDRLEAQEHSLSSAARAFKEQALHAARANPRVDAVEELFSTVGLPHAAVHHSR
jgi:hypothetical protein